LALNLAADRDAGAELASFGEIASEEAASDGSDLKLQTSHFKLEEEKITPDGVTTNEADGIHGRDARAALSQATSDEGQATLSPAEPLHACPFTLHDQSRETNPIAGGWPPCAG